ncbi:thermostable hemolysin [Microbulbifer bruguierae]|uniref:Thermostable hemolysin n=1 Tax=Microbulbifer bruguierae TaxID=3029061 RepID=A0ABY8NK35_9GAMM|nr:thermostable hemolysin [Microbulbifer bruguierae]WGL18427.1 thermostable hemolysin [Microbulbifer bruguierae]
MAVDIRTPYAFELRGLAGGYAGRTEVLGGEPVARQPYAASGDRAEDSETSPPLTFQFSGDEDAARTTVETYIARQFQQVYGARLQHFMPWLLSYGHGQQIDGVLGLRQAAREPLFLEQYFDEPLESLLEACAGVPVDRADIVEIGNLVATARGGSRLLFLMLAELFAAADLTWAIFTATPEVQHLLQKLTDNQLFLCRADGSRLGAELADWGSYYNTRPAVVAINVKAERERRLERPLISELLAVCRPQATAFARQWMEAGV